MPVLVLLGLLCLGIRRKRRRGWKPYYIQRREAIAARKAAEEKARQAAARQRERERLQADKAAQAAKQAAERAEATRQKELARIAKETEAALQRAEKARQEKAQAAEDIPYYKNQLARFHEMIAGAKIELQAARNRCRLDSDMNAHGAIIAEKIVSKHIAERDKALTKVVRLENQIHAMEKKLLKAETIINT